MLAIALPVVVLNPFTHYCLQRYYQPTTRSIVGICRERIMQLSQICRAE